jgi:hypothetical protein
MFRKEEPYSEPSIEAEPSGVKDLWYQDRYSARMMRPAKKATRKPTTHSQGKLPM